MTQVESSRIAPSPHSSTPRPNIDKFVATVRKRYDFSPAEAELLRDRMTETQSYAPGEYLVNEGDRIGYSSLLLEGYAARSKDTSDGERQIMELQIPGDFVDLHSYPLEVLDHGICALSRCTIVKLHHEDISALIEAHPRLARILWFSTMVDASIHREWIMNIGSRSGKARIAHLLLELLCRCEVVGLADGDAYWFPLNQTQIGECLGFTQMHVNRLLKELREQELVVVRSQQVEVLDRDGLEKLADFNPSYLYLDERTA
ncbi:Crp/Fnr family transcriptional regulator [Aurantiacibacter poecillastricola]|uniref:Crp/Fnr family transcriptional regulator n=1 Tax=Aurantiacibacter poecillastricola TaxID=3064385 RepID=UPI00273FA955|nr:Crp/Fnr family transcriptional regulator [Aurantiacibacter sp. 219JJ12-13]MDP5261727.1 Crp/Fnr family transcriptional regulator [Aurantiacibacter sp. 219JJ12-13]